MKNAAVIFVVTVVAIVVANYAIKKGEQAIEKRKENKAETAE